MAYSDEHWMRLALLEAREASERGEVPIGAIIVAGDRLIAKGSNLVETLKDATAHAEMLALGAAMQYYQSKYLADCTLYVTVEPCAMCMGAIRWSRIARVVYACSDPKAGYSVLAPRAPHPRCVIEQGLLEDEARDLMQTFFAKRRIERQG